MRRVIVIVSVLVVMFFAYQERDESMGEEVGRPVVAVIYDAMGNIVDVKPVGDNIRIERSRFPVSGTVFNFKSTTLAPAKSNPQELWISQEGVLIKVIIP